MSRLKEIQKLQTSLGLDNVSKMLRDQAVEHALQWNMAAMDAEIEALSGKKDSRKKNNGAAQALRAGSDKVNVLVLGQKKTISKPRLKIIENGKRTEIPLKSYEALRDGVDQQEYLQAMIAGASSGDFHRLREFYDQRGLSGSAVCRKWEEAGQDNLKELNTRDLSEKDIRCIMMDVVHLGNFSILTALGISMEGEKIILGFEVGTSESGYIVGQLMSKILKRGISQTKPILFIIDGSKGLRAGIEKSFGDRAIIQRCILHKCRNITDKLRLREKYNEDPTPEELRALEQTISQFEWRWKNLHCMNRFDQAKEYYDQIITWLSGLEGTERAIKSMRESKLETLTLIRLNVPKQLRRFLGTTNAIESVFSHVRKRSQRVTYWREEEHGINQVTRWTSNLLMDIEHRLQPMYDSQMPGLATSLDKHLNRQGTEGLAESFNKARSA